MLCPFELVDFDKLSGTERCEGGVKLMHDLFLDEGAKFSKQG